MLDLDIRYSLKCIQVPVESTPDDVDQPSHASARVFCRIGIREPLDCASQIALVPGAVDDFEALTSAYGDVIPPITVLNHREE